MSNKNKLQELTHQQVSLAAQLKQVWSKDGGLILSGVCFWCQNQNLQRNVFKCRALCSFSSVCPHHNNITHLVNGGLYWFIYSYIYIHGWDPDTQHCRKKLETLSTNASQASMMMIIKILFFHLCGQSPKKWIGMHWNWKCVLPISKKQLWSFFWVRVKTQWSSCPFVNLKMFHHKSKRLVSEWWVLH